MSENQLTKQEEAIVDGFQGEDNTKQESIVACAKHYIGYGAVEGGRDYGRAEISDYTLHNYYLPPFKSAIDIGAATIMSSFNEISGTSVTASKYMLTDILRDELGFKGFVVSDWESVEQLIDQGLAENRAEAAKLALNAGLDMNMVGRSYIENLERLVADGKVREETIDTAVLRILYIKLKFGLFDINEVKPIPIDEEKHIKLAKICADESIVLLKNKNNILPLSKEKSVVVTGPFAHERRSLFGSWALDGDINKVKTISESIVEIGANVLPIKNNYLWDDCLIPIHKAECIIVALGESSRLTGEANSVANIEIHREQIEYIKRLRSANKPIIAIMCYGRPTALEEIEPYLDAIVYAWHGGTMIGESIASVIYGDVNPSGKLPMTFPRCTGQIPIYYNAPECSRFCNLYYGPIADHMFSYHDCQGTPMYPFGYGLSYTNFKYEHINCQETSLKLSQIENGKKFKFEIDVKNIGDVKGKEVVQCYVQDTFASMMRPKRELKGFCKTEINPGETKCIIFEIGFEELGFYNNKGKYSNSKRI